jgi:P pilus assembly chaperone PapD
MFSRRLLVLAAISTIVAMTVGAPSLAKAQVGADLSISPKRVTFDETGRSATVYIFNRGSQAATYSLGLVDRVMTPDGQIRTVAESAGAPEGTAANARLKSATPLLTFAPRRVTLRPGESQTVRIRVLRPADLAVGEYRTHLTVTDVPPETAGLTAEEAAAPGTGELAVRIVALFSVSIPVIVRQGPADVQAGIDTVRFAVTDLPTAPGATVPKRTGFLTIDLVRQGASSLFGDVEIRAVKAGKPGEVVGGAKGVAVYGEIDRRTLALPLTRIPTSGETLNIVFRDDDTRAGAPLATADFTVP